MEQKINIGEVTITEFNLIMKQLTEGKLGECLDLFLRLRQIAEEFQFKQQNVSALQNIPFEPAPGTNIAPPAPDQP